MSIATRIKDCSLRAKGGVFWCLILNHQTSAIFCVNIVPLKAKGSNVTLSSLHSAYTFCIQNAYTLKCKVIINT